MFKWSIAIIFASFLGVIYSPDSTTTPIAVSDVTLAEIQPDEVLPLVLFELTNSLNVKLEKETLLEVPEGLDEAAISRSDGRLVEGTKFYSSKSENQLFFCPKGTSDECLAPKKFGNGERLQYPRVPVPMVELQEQKCNVPGHNGVLYAVFYAICPSEEPYNYETTKIPLYYFCYDENEEKTLYTKHTIISPELLSSKVLSQKRSVNYSLPVNDEFKTANNKIIRSTLDLESITQKHPKYVVQTLVPNKEMPFALWRKSLYRFFNVELLHETLVPLWNDLINGSIVKEAARIYNKKTEFIVKTWVLPIDDASQSKDDDQIYNIWVKLITAKSNSSVVGQLFPPAVAILMNNFLDLKTDQSEVPKSIRTKIDSYCARSGCERALRERFTHVKGRVRCCAMTGPIIKLLGLPHWSNTSKILIIPGITSETP